MSYQVLRNYNNHIVIVTRQSPKDTEYLVLSSSGPVVETNATTAFNKLYYRSTNYTPVQAAVKFLGAAHRAFAFNEKAILILKEIVMSNSVTEEAQRAIDAASTPTQAQLDNAAKKAARAEKVKAARPKKEPGERKPRGFGVGAFCVGRILEGATNAEILAEVKAKWPDAKTSAASLGWYRNDLKKKSADAPLKKAT